jgi:selenocysteine lyase/cysteine desulfurase
MVVLNHGSNVVGTLLPLEPVGGICLSHGILFMVDAAQTAGVIPIDMEKENIDLLAFRGTKPFLGLRELGFGYQRGEEKSIQPLKGGTESSFEEQPDFLPDLRKRSPIPSV